MKEVLNPKERVELKVENVTFRSFYDHRVTEDDLKQAHLELGETEEKKSDSLLKLKDSLMRDKAFNYRLDDGYLLRFLRHRKFDVEKAYSMIRKFYEFKKECPEIFGIPSNLEYLLSQDVVRCLPYRDEEGSTIFWFDTHKWKLDEMSVWDLMTIINAMSDVTTMNPSIQINGTIGFWDVAGLTASHLSNLLHPRILRLFLKSLQSHYPWRIKRVVVLNCNAVYQGAYKVIRHFLNKKVADRIILLGSDISEVHQYINPRLLPKTYGGCIEEYECSIAQYIKDNLPYIEYERSFGPNTED